MSYLEWMLPQNPTLFQSVSCKKLLKNGYLMAIYLPSFRSGARKSKNPMLVPLLLFRIWQLF